MRKQINMSIRGLLVLFFLAVVPTTHSKTVQPTLENIEHTETSETPPVHRKISIEERLDQAKQSLTVDDDTLINLHKNDKSLYCMAQAAFFEAKSEPFVGKVAVSEVVKNRAQSDKFPSDICGVVRQSFKKKTVTGDGASKAVVVTKVCQFSWVCKGKGVIPLRDGFGKIRPEILRQWRDSVLAAMIVYQETVSGVAKGATHFYSRSDGAPHWARMERTGKIGNHTFFKVRSTPKIR